MIYYTNRTQGIIVYWGYNAWKIMHVILTPGIAVSSIAWMAVTWGIQIEPKVLLSTGNIMSFHHIGNDEGRRTETFSYMLGGTLYSQ